MKKPSLLCLLTSLLTISSCSSTVEEPVSTKSNEETAVTLTFSPYDVEPMTRAATSIADFCTHLDVWISEENGTQEIHQSSSDDNFGVVTIQLNKLKTYSLIAVAHKCTDNATLSDGTVIAFPDDKITHSMVYTTSFTPATQATLNCEMQRIVGWFRLEIADAVPDEVAKFVYTIPSTFTRWNISGTATNQTDRTGTINLTSRNQDGTANINLYIMPSSITATDKYDITVSAQTSDSQVLEERKFPEVPIRASYKTTYHGTFFVTESMSMTFTATDWNTLTTINY